VVSPESYQSTYDWNTKGFFFSRTRGEGTLPYDIPRTRSRRGVNVIPWSMVRLF
jgi:hypothetical protein